MNNVKRVYPGAKNGLINWMEENFHEIDSYVATFTMKNGNSMVVYDCHTLIEAFGIIGLSHAKITELANDDEFTPKKGDNND
jgi:hypothetical protein